MALIFVIHKHHARTLHYDVRLEHDGVLVSWAVPKEPPTASGIKRLALRVDDHALSYATFEGDIEEGHYGAGRVEIWDTGTYECRSWEAEEIVVTLAGKRLRGTYCVIRFHVPNSKGTEWLFFKKKEQ